MFGMLFPLWLEWANIAGRARLLSSALGRNVGCLNRLVEAAGSKGVPAAFREVKEWCWRGGGLEARQKDAASTDLAFVDGE